MAQMRTGAIRVGFLTASVCVVGGLCSEVTRADSIIIPGPAATSGGFQSYTTVVNASPKSWLVVIGQEELSGLPSGALITGVSFRLASWPGALPSWPTTLVSVSEFEIYLGRAALPPEALDTGNAANNWGPDLTRVRSGEWIFGLNSFPGGAVSPGFNPFSAPIPFMSAYPYQGGDLLLMVRHTGTGAGGGTPLDWVASPAGPPGGGSIRTSSFTSNAGWVSEAGGGNTAVMLTYTPPTPSCYANCDGSTVAPTLNIADFTCFLQKFVVGHPYADCNVGGAPPQFNVADFTCYLTKFVGGCP